MGSATVQGQLWGASLEDHAELLEEEQRQYFRAERRSGETASLADRRRVFQERRAADMAELTAA